MDNLDKLELVQNEQNPPTEGLPTYDSSNLCYAQHGGIDVMHNMTSGAQPVITQPSQTNQHIVVTQPSLHQPRPSHGFAIVTLVIAIITFVITFPTSALCTIPAMILSCTALARDYRVEEARQMSMISLILTVIYYVCVVIAFAVFFIIYMVEVSKVDHYSSGGGLPSQNSDSVYI